MIATLQEVVVTPEDLLAMPDGEIYELVDGKLVERNMGVMSNHIEVIVGSLLHSYVRTNKLGRVLGNSLGYQCFPNSPRKVRKPDITFVQADRLSDQKWEDGFSHIHPDLAVEIVSPNDLYYEVDKKIDEYFEVGVRLIWVINPENRTVMVHRVGGDTQRLTETNDITGEDVIPGFRCSVRDFFPEAVES